jgi:protein-S-isoprenylcysteine O-methyltransferase Ste14
MNQLYRRAAIKSLQLPLIIAVLLFLPAGTIRYWEGWLFLAVFVGCSLAITAYLGVVDPKLLESRMKAGPGAEKEPSQKIIVLFVLLCSAALLVVSALDHRFGWSHVPPYVVCLGNALIVLSYVGIYFMFRANRYAAAAVRVAEGQTVVTTGPYAVVRHPMYSWGLVLMAGIPLALGSLWGLSMLVPAGAGIVARLLNEERLLAKNLPGYAEYMRRVSYRLVPLVW